MDEILPWAALCDIIEPFYLKASAQSGRPAIGITRMLRIHFYSMGLNCLTPAPKKPCMTHERYASLLALTWPVNRRPMTPLSASLTTVWKGTIQAVNCFV